MRQRMGRMWKLLMCAGLGRMAGEWVVGCKGIQLRIEISIIPLKS